MIARKGVLLSDPTVQEMTHAMWLREYAAQKSREKHESERTQEWFIAAITSFRETLIQVLGLRMRFHEDKADVEKENEKAQEESTSLIPRAAPFVGLSLLCGNPEALKAHFMKLDESTRAQEALEDTEYNTFMDQMAKGEFKFNPSPAGDMEPLDQRALNSIGVTKRG